jgi:hypothetical protein
MTYEVWRDVVGYEGLYQVSNLGRVKSLDRTFTDAEGKTCTRRGKVLKQSLKRDGYLHVTLYGENARKTCSVHRLVAMAFFDVDANRHYVDHIDGDKTNNNANNLRWCTPSENTNYAIERGTIRLDKFAEAAKKATERRGRKWCMTRIMREDGVIYESIAEAAKDLGVKRAAIHNALKGVTKTCKGHTLRVIGKQSIDEAYARGAANSLRQITEQARPVIRSDGKWFPSVRAAARAIGAKDSNIGKVAQGKRNTCMGYSFKYADEDSK